MNARQKVAMAGAGLLFIGVFLPAVHVPVLGPQNYIQNGLGVGALVIALPIVGAAGAARESYAACFLAGTSVLLLLAWNLVRFVAGINALRQSVESSLSPFEHGVETLEHSVQLQYGFAVLVLGGLALAGAGAYRFDSGSGPFATTPKWIFVAVGVTALIALTVSLGIGWWISGLKYSSGRAVAEPEVLGPLFPFARPSLYVVCGTLAGIAALAFIGARNRNRRPGKDAPRNSA